MADDRHKRLSEIFGRVVDLPPEERDDLLRRVCATPDEREEILTLLRQDSAQGVLPMSGEGAGAVVARAIVEAGSAHGGGGPLPDRVGGYSILRELGSGAMGRVLLARQEHTDQLVALKLVRPGLALTTPKALERFERETKILGRLSDPGIARILDAGTASVAGRDQPYLAMEYVDGRQLLEYAGQEHLGLRDRLDLVVQLCDAVQHAHAAGIVHRDLKPENVLVGDDGHPKVLDFGVALMADADAQLTTVRTDGGQLIGTLAYMSPEQAAGGSHTLDARSDVYALGVLAFELLSGHRPHNLSGLDFVVAVRRVCENDPQSLRELAPHVPRDVATIIHKALETEPRRRYSTAAALAEDFRRYLYDRPILARPATGVYVVRKLARRHRGLAAGLASAFVMLVVGAAVSSVLAARAMRASEAARWQTYLATLAAASSEVHGGSMKRARRRLDLAPREHRGAEWNILENLADQSIFTLEGHAYNVWNVAVSPDGARAYSCAGDATVRVWDLEQGTEVAVLGDHGERVFSVAASPDGSRLASGSADRTIRLRDAQTFETIAVLEGHDEGVFGLAFSVDGKLLASGANNGTLRLWDAHDGASVSELDGHSGHIWSIAFHPDGSRMATAADDGVVNLWDLASGALVEVLAPDANRVVDVSFNRDGSKLALATTSGELQVWDVDYAERLAGVTAHQGELGCVAFAPDDRHIVTGARDGTITIWSSDLMTRIATRVGHSDWVQSLAFSSDGRKLVSGSWDDSLRVWDAARLDERVAPTVQPDVLRFRTSRRTPGSVFIIGADGRIQQRDLLTGRALPPTPADDDPSELVMFPWSVDSDAIARVSGIPDRASAIDLPGRSARANADGSLIAVTTAVRNEVELLDPRSGESVGGIETDGLDLVALAFDPSGERLLSTGDADCSVRVWDVATGRQVAVLEGHVNTVQDAVFDTDGDLLATSGVDQVTYLWDAHTLQRIGALSDHGSTVRCATFSPDGTRVVTGTEDGKLRFWFLATLDELAVLQVGEDSVLQMEFTPGGDLLVVRTGAGEMLVLDAR